MCSWGELWTKDTERPKNPTTTLEEPGAKTGCQEQKQGTEHTLCPQNLSHPSSPASGHIPTLTSNKEQACPFPRGASKEPVVFSCSALLLQGPQ